ncbi:hypothetical protein V1477_009490 [Vespula maculifrons]|uniref:Uncharacterized protein n=1 Tax=Vespula maculifrons TaxID=7453 RepID=A0ABD2C9X5_VESMC
MPLVSINEESTQVYFLSLIFSKSCTVSCVSDFDAALSKTDDLLPRVDLEIFTLAWILTIYLHETVNLSPRVNLENFVDAIRVSINEQLIQIYNSSFDFRLKCEVGIFSCALDFDQCTQKFSRMPFVHVLTNNLNAKRGYVASRDDNNIGYLTDIYNSWFSCALDFDQ